MILLNEYDNLIASRKKVFFRCDFWDSKAIVKTATITVNEDKSKYIVFDNSKTYENCFKTFNNEIEAIEFIKAQKFIEAPDNFDRYNLATFEHLITDQEWLENHKMWLDYYENS